MADDLPSFADSVVISRSPDDVYALVSDVTRMGEWSPICRACWWEDGSGPRVGAWFRGRNEGDDGQSWETRSQVVVADPGREFGWEVTAGYVRWSYRVEAERDGTRLTESWRLLPAGQQFFHDKYGERAGARIALRTEQAYRGIPATLAAIKQAAEGTAG